MSSSARVSGSPLRLRAIDLGAQRVVEVAPVVQPGQPVAHRLLAQRQRSRRLPSDSFSVSATVSAAQPAARTAHRRGARQWRCAVRPGRRPESTPARRWRARCRRERTGSSATAAGDARTPACARALPAGGSQAGGAAGAVQAAAAQRPAVGLAAGPRRRGSCPSARYRHRAGSVGEGHAPSQGANNTGPARATTAPAPASLSHDRKLFAELLQPLQEALAGAHLLHQLLEVAAPRRGLRLGLLQRVDADQVAAQRRSGGVAVAGELGTQLQQLPAPVAGLDATAVLRAARARPAAPRPARRSSQTAPHRRGAAARRTAGRSGAPLARCRGRVAGWHWRHAAGAAARRRSRSRSPGRYRTAARAVAGLVELALEPTVAALEFSAAPAAARAARDADDRGRREHGGQQQQQCEPWFQRTTRRCRYNSNHCTNATALRSARGAGRQAKQRWRQWADKGRFSAPRIERDSMGEMAVPADALYGAQTQRAIDNFPISGRPMPRGFMRALLRSRRRRRGANVALGLLDAERAARRSPPPATSCCADDALHARISRSTCSRPARAPARNMNANEVVATLAARRLGRARRIPTTTSTPARAATTSSRPAIHVSAALARARASCCRRSQHLAQTMRRKAARARRTTSRPAART